MRKEQKLIISEIYNTWKWPSPIDSECYFMPKNQISNKSVNKTTKNPNMKKWVMSEKWVNDE